MFFDKNKEIITTKEKSKALSLNDEIIITAKNFEYLMSLNIISAYQNVKIEDQKRQYLLTSDFIKYSVNNYKIISEGNSQIVNLKDQTK